jgi:hypothetical protein
MHSMEYTLYACCCVHQNPMPSQQILYCIEAAHRRLQEEFIRLAAPVNESSLGGGGVEGGAFDKLLLEIHQQAVGEEQSVSFLLK